MTLKPDPDGQNNDRSSWAEAAIEAFESETGTDREDAVADLLCDLMHWCDRNDQNFASEFRRAIMHYVAETDGEKTAFETPTASAPTPEEMLIKKAIKQGRANSRARHLRRKKAKGY